MKRTAVVLLAVSLLLTGCRRLAAQTQPPSQELPSVTEETLTVTEAPTALPTQPSTQPPTEETVAVRTAEDEFVPVTNYVPNVRVELAYATADNFTGQVIYNFTEGYLRYATVRKLADAAAALEEEGYGIRVWDAYRPVHAQQRLWDICPDPAYVSKPGTGSQSHCRGIAVDITLYDLRTGELLEMPTGFDDFSKLADRDYSDCTPEAAAHALLLEQVMTDCGFKPYRGEWWHFADTQSFEVEYEFDPSQSGEG